MAAFGGRVIQSVPGITRQDVEDSVADAPVTNPSCYPASLPQDEVPLRAAQCWSRHEKGKIEQGYSGSDYGLAVRLCITVHGHVHTGLRGVEGGKGKRKRKRKREEGIDD